MAARASRIPKVMAIPLGQARIRMEKAGYGMLWDSVPSQSYEVVTKNVAGYILDLAAHINGFNEWRALIRLYGDAGTVIAELRFVESSMDWDNYINPDGCSICYLPADYFADAVDILRNEKPVVLFLYVHPDRLPDGSALLRSGWEPVGEGEG